MDHEAALQDENVIPSCLKLPLMELLPSEEPHIGDFDTQRMQEKRGVFIHFPDAKSNIRERNTGNKTPPGWKTFETGS